MFAGQRVLVTGSGRGIGKAWCRVSASIRNYDPDLRQIAVGQEEFTYKTGEPTIMPKIVRFHQTGPAEVLRIEDLPQQQPKEGEVRLRVEAIGLNRAEIMFRTGTYLETPAFPARLGLEAAGVVDGVGQGVTGMKIGDRVSTVPSFSMSSHGVYGEAAIVPAHAVVRYPHNLTPVEGARYGRNTSLLGGRSFTMARSAPAKTY